MIMTSMYAGVVITGKCNTSMTIICQYQPVPNYWSGGYHQPKQYWYAYDQPVT